MVGPSFVIDATIMSLPITTVRILTTPLGDSEAHYESNDSSLVPQYMSSDTHAYNSSLNDSDKAICDALQGEISTALSEAESKIWHGHPVWFLEGNPIVGYDKLNDSVRLLFWSGQTFEEDNLKPEGAFKAAEVRYPGNDHINADDLRRWLKKARSIQWDYKNIVKRRGVLERLI